jgi:hypothetical protein
MTEHRRQARSCLEPLDADGIIAAGAGASIVVKAQTALRGARDHRSLWAITLTKLSLGHRQNSRSTATSIHREID